MSIIREALNKLHKYETKLNTDGPFKKGRFVFKKKRFSCDINPQNKICIEKLPLGTVPCIIAIEDDEPGYFNFIKEHCVTSEEGKQFGKIEQTPLTTRYCENRQEVAEEIIRLSDSKLQEGINNNKDIYTKEIAEKLFKEVNANAPIEEYVLHTPEDFYPLYRSGDYIVINKVVMEEIMDEIINSLENTLPAELQMCFDHTRAVNTCLNDVHVLSSVYIQVQALDKRFDTEFGMIQREVRKGNTYFLVNITE